MMSSSPQSTVSSHAEWLKPFLDESRGVIRLHHNTLSSRLSQIRTDGLKIPQNSEDYNWGSSSDIAAVFAYVPHVKSLNGTGDSTVQFEYPISQVRVRPPLISHQPEKYGVQREGIPLREFLQKEPPSVWKLVTGIEFLVLENIPATCITKI